MKTFTRMAAQGDAIFLRIDVIPSNVEKVQPENGKVIVAHSESGHSHVMEATTVTAYKPAGVKEVDLYQLFLQVDEPTELVHLRSFDTHETIVFPAGKYEIRRQREHVPEGFRRAQD